MKNFYEYILCILYVCFNAYALEAPCILEKIRLNSSAATTLHTSPFGQSAASVTLLLYVLYWERCNGLDAVGVDIASVGD